MNLCEVSINVPVTLYISNMYLQEPGSGQWNVITDKEILDSIPDVVLLKCGQPVL